MFRLRCLSSSNVLRAGSSRLNSSKPDLDLIQNKHLLPNKGLINGEFTSGKTKSGDTFDVVNPANGKVVAQLPKMREADTLDGIAAAKKAFQTSWKQTSAYERSKYLEKISELMNKYKKDLATIMTLENGKNLKEAAGEIDYAISFVDYYAEEAKRIRGDILQSPQRDKKLITIKQPVGVTALITPWNFPSAMITRKLAPALAAGCTAVIKPASETPLSALAICAIAQEAGVPAGVINCLTVTRDQHEEVGKALCHSKDVRKLSFTGSTSAGKWLMRESAENVKKLSLELGGNAPFIVFDDCEMEVALKALMAAKFQNSGQTCISANRIMVQEGIYEEFAKQITEKVKKLKVGDGFDSDTRVGPLINEKALNKVNDTVQDAISKGAKVLTGGKISKLREEKGGFFYEPTVLTGVTKEMRPFQQETFGPVIPLVKFKTVEEGIELANDTE
jgi:succinate-semialdehyde dehydrogenase/glutarate-semialdehyde dehydrogenase